MLLTPITKSRDPLSLIQEDAFNHISYPGLPRVIEGVFIPSLEVLWLLLRELGQAFPRFGVTVRELNGIGGSGVGV